MWNAIVQCPVEDHGAVLDEIVHKAVEAWAKLDENALQNQLIEARADAPVAEKVWRF